MTQLFGTDGIRGTANRPPITVETAVAIGRALAVFSRRNNNQKDRPVTIIIGKDTRLSGGMLESAVCAGACSMGADVYLAGVFPTPGIASLVTAEQADAGVVISASHNPYTDNGFKIFDKNGYKLSRHQEIELEGLISDYLNRPDIPHDTGQPGRSEHLAAARDRYAIFLRQTVFAETLSLSGSRSLLGDLKLVVDCAHGAACMIAESVISRATFLFNQPDGKNINDQCGSEHPQALCRQVVGLGADAGFAFDGDADRVVAVDETGRILTGDRILAICAAYMKKNSLLKNNVVVSTVMSNIGLSRALKKMGIDHVTADVGDRQVLEKMKACGAVIGGEDSGHIIFTDHQTTGDGILTALVLCKIIRETSQPLSRLARCMTVYPQELINVPVIQKPDLDTVDSVQQTMSEVTGMLGREGRVLVRYSGTQPLCRVMVEAATAEIARTAAVRIADAIEQALGA